MATNDDADSGRPRQYTFGPFRLDIDTGLLYRDGEEVPLPPRAVELLRHFLEHPDTVLSKADLIDAIWKDTFVGEDSLMQAISLIRHALGDDPRQPRYIRTLPRRGYVFVAPVAAVESVQSAGPSRSQAAPDADADGSPPAPATSTAVLMYTEIEDSVSLKARMGLAAFSALLQRHDELLREILAAVAGAAVVANVGDGFVGRFATASDSVRSALSLQRRWAGEEQSHEAVGLRIGLHLGEVAEVSAGDDRHTKVVGLTADWAACVAGLARGGQILMTRPVFDDARQNLRSDDEGASVSEGEAREIVWMAHGRYLIEGIDEPVPLFEVGEADRAPLKAPPDGAAGRRAVSLDEEETLGWRPAVGLPVPTRSGWKIERQLGEGGFGEVWVGRNEKTRARRVFKFCFDPERLRSLKRELTLFRLLQSALGDRPDIARLYEVHIDSPPYFLEGEFMAAGNLAEWAKSRDGIGAVPLPTRLRLLAEVAEAVDVAHSVGILHKDLKPSNILIREEDGEPHPVLADFGIGAVIDRSRLEQADFTVTGFTESVAAPTPSSPSGTLLYMAPEVLSGEPATVRADVHALGVILYQLVIGDLRRPLAPGWRREVEDELICEHIAACVDGDPTRRPKTAAAVATRIRTLERQRRDRAAVEREARVRRLMKGALAAGVALALVGSLALWIAYGMQRRSTRLRAASILLTARGSADPLLSALLLSELAAQPALAAELDTTDPGGPLNLAHRVAETPLPYAVLRGHDNVVSSVAFSPDGSKVLTSSWDGTLRIWPSDGSGDARALRGHQAAVRGAVFSADGTRVLSWSSDRTARVWDLASGSAIVLRGHELDVTQASFSPDGTRVATASEDGTARVWSLGGAAEPIVLPHDDQVMSLAFSPDGNYLASSSRGATLIWNLDDTAQPFAVLRHDDERTAVPSTAFSPDGSMVVAASNAPPDYTARVWRIDDGALLAVLRGHTDAIRSVAFDPGGNRVLTGSHDATARVFALDGSFETVVLQRPESGAGIESAALDSTGELVVTADLDGSATVWRADGRGDPVVLRGHAGAVQAAAFDPEGMRVATASTDGTARLWHADGSREELVIRAHPEIARSVSFDGDGMRLVTGGDESNAIVWTLRADGGSGTGAGLGLDPDPVVLRGHEDVVMCASFGPDGRHIVTGSLDGSARIWNADGSGTPLVLRGHEAAVRCAAFDASGSRVVTASMDRTARIWQVSFPQPRGDPVAAVAALEGEPAVLSGHEGPVLKASFSPDGTRVVTASQDTTARLWDAADGTQLLVLRGHSGLVRDVAFSPTGERIVTASTDGTARIVRADDDGDALVLGEPGDAALSAVAFSPDGTYVATGLLAHSRMPGGRLLIPQELAETTLVLVWHADGRGQPLLVGTARRDVANPSRSGWNPQNLHVNGLAFSPDQRLLAAAYNDGTVRVTRITWDGLTDYLRAATTACLTAAERERLLAESASEARAAYRACEIEHGRTPR